MTSPRGQVRRALERHRARLISKAAARLADHPEAGVGVELARLEAIDKVLAALPVPWSRTALAPLAMALVCVAVVGALWTITTDALGLRTVVVLTVDAGTVDMRLADAWEGSEPIRLADGRIRIERAALTFSDPRHGFRALPDEAWADVEAAGATLQDLSLKPGTDLTLELTDDDAIDVYAAGGSAAGSLLVNGPVTLAWGEADDTAPQTSSFRVDVPERITFTAARPHGMPARLAFQPGESLTLRNLAVSDLRFGREAAATPGEFAFFSTVRGGQLRLPDLNESYDLSAGYSVILRGLTGQVRQLRVEGGGGDKDVIAVDLEGTVERVIFGPHGRERNATPNILTYLYHNQRLTFLFAAASFIWGTLWSLRRLVGA